MRIRTIKPEFWSHPILGRASDSTKCLALALLNFADDEGFFLADPALVRSSCRPFDDHSRISTVLLHDLSKLGWIRVVLNPDLGAVGQVVKFKENQVINKPKPSKLKQYFIDPVCVPYEYGIDTTGKGMEGNGKEQGKERFALTDFEADDVGDQEPDQDQDQPTQPTTTTKKPKIIFDYEEGVWIGIKAEHLERWGKAFPALNLEQECNKAACWCMANPKNKKSNWEAFLSNWFTRAQDRAPTGGGQVVPFQKPVHSTFAQQREENSMKAAISFVEGAPNA